MHIHLNIPEAPSSRGLPFVAGKAGPRFAEAILVLGAVVVWLLAGTAALVAALGS